MVKDASHIQLRKPGTAYQQRETPNSHWNLLKLVLKPICTKKHSLMTIKAHARYFQLCVVHVVGTCEQFWISAQ